MIKGQGGIMGKERLLQLEEYIKVQQKVSPETLCEKFGVSMSTLRRDINTLEQMGCVQKAYGCILYNYSAAKIIPFHVRSTINQEQKRDACAAAASLIQDNDTIFIDSGSTTCHLMDFMASFKNLTVITSNLDIILRATSMENISLLVCSGELNRKNNSLSPVTGTDILNHFNFSKAFMAASRVSLTHGFSHSYISERPLKQAVLEKPVQHYFIVDNSKFGVKALLNMGPLRLADAICTNKLPEPRYVEFCLNHNISLLAPDTQNNG